MQDIPKKRYVAFSRELAFNEAKRDFGDDAFIIDEREVTEGGIFGFFGVQKVELIVGKLPEQPKPKVEPRRPVAAPSAVSRGNEGAEFIQKLLSKGAMVNPKQQLKPKTDQGLCNEMDALRDAIFEVTKGNKDLKNPGNRFNAPSSKGFQTGLAPDVLSSIGNTQLKNRPAPKSSEQVTKDDFNELKSLVEKMQSNLMQVVSQPGNAKSQNSENDVYQRLQECLIEADFSKEVAQTYHKVFKKEYKSKETPTLNQLLDGVANKFERSLTIRGDLLDSSEKSDLTKVIALVGPTGVGKTTTVAKIASKLKEQGKTVALVTMDTFRIGAMEQLQWYADGIKSPLTVVFHPEKMSDTIEKLKEFDVIMLDTVGKGPREQEQINRIKEYFPTDCDLEVHLVISSVCKYKDMIKIVRGYNSLHVDSLLFTKLDETEVYGPMLSVVQKSSRPISFLTNGQMVPDDCLAAEKGYLVNLVKEMLKPFREEEIEEIELEFKQDDLSEQSQDGELTD
jgi:flagellar biosynthesis protein FlhF